MGDDRARRGAKWKAVLNVGGRGRGLPPKSLLQRDQQGDSNILTFLFKKRETHFILSNTLK